MPGWVVLRVAELTPQPASAIVYRCGTSLVRRLSAMLVCLSAIVVLGGCTGTSEVSPSGYRLADQQGVTLTLLVPAGVGDEVAAASVVRQGEDRVEVAVEVRQGDDNRPGVEITLEPTVKLDAPLADRLVVDRKGHEVPRLA